MNRDLIRPWYRPLVNPQLRLDNRCCHLFTIRKSGTNYVRLFLANYIALIRDPNAPIQHYPDAHALLPQRERLKDGIPSALPGWRYKTMCYSHRVQHEAIASIRSPVLFVYRNPLDQLVSLYHYGFKQRPDRADKIQHPRDLIPTEAPKYAANLAAMIEHHRRCRHAMLLSYEALTADPRTHFPAIVKHFRLPLDHAAIDRAIERASPRTVRAYEAEHGAIHAPQGFTGRFARNGKIGQWRKWFDSRDAESVLCELTGIDRHLLTFDPPSERPPGAHDDIGA